MTGDARRLVLVAGATGHQGGATADHLLNHGVVRVRAMTRNPSRANARRLADRGAEVVQADLDDRPSLERALAGASGVFSVQNFFDGGVEAEARRGMALAEVAQAAGVKHFVYTSVDGAERASGVPHFGSKWRVEQRIGELGLPATILRPTTFMDNFGPSWPSQLLALGFMRMMLGPTGRLQMVATTDIGWFAAQALERPHDYAGRAIALAGDELNFREMAAAYRRVTGRPRWLPQALPIPALALRLMPREGVQMAAWIRDHGYAADVASLRREHPGLLTLEAWLRRRGAVSGVGRAGG